MKFFPENLKEKAFVILKNYGHKLDDWYDDKKSINCISINCLNSICKSKFDLQMETKNSDMIIYIIWNELKMISGFKIQNNQLISLNHLKDNEVLFCKKFISLV